MVRLIPAASRILGLGWGGVEWGCSVEGSCAVRWRGMQV